MIREVSLGQFKGLPENTHAEVEIDFSSLDVGERVVISPFDPIFAAVQPNIATQGEKPKLTIGTPSAESRLVDGSVAFPELFSKD